MREEAQGEEGQHWLVAHASEILLMVISTFAYAVYKGLIAEYAKSFVQVLLQLLRTIFVPEPQPQPQPQPGPPTPRPSPPSSRDTLEFEKKGQSVTITTLRQSLKYADVEHAACESPVSIRRAGDTTVDTGIEHLLASLKPSHIKQVRGALWTFEGDLEHLRELIMGQYLSSEGGGLARFVNDCPASLQREFQRVLRLKDAATPQITAGIVLLGAHHYFQKFPNHLKKEWCRNLGLKLGGTAAELERRLMSHFFTEWETRAWLELRCSLISREHESYPVLSESEDEDDEEGEGKDHAAGSESDDEQPLSTWADKIAWVLQQYVEGEATLSEIYGDIEGKFPEDIAGKPNWRAAVRSCLSTNTAKGRFVVEDTPDGRAWRLGH